MNISKHKRLACAAAFALFFGACAGSAWAETIYETVDSQDKITVENDTEYIIDVSSGNGVDAENTDITIGTEGVTQNISITATDTDGRGIYAHVTEDSNSDSSVTLNADNIIIESGTARPIYLRIR